jgi:hypothetical protein
MTINPNEYSSNKPNFQKMRSRGKPSKKDNNRDSKKRPKETRDKDSEGLELEAQQQALEAQRQIMAESEAEKSEASTESTLEEKKEEIVANINKDADEVKKIQPQEEPDPIDQAVLERTDEAMDGLGVETIKEINAVVVENESQPTEESKETVNAYTESDWLAEYWDVPIFDSENKTEHNPNLSNTGPIIREIQNQAILRNILLSEQKEKELTTKNLEEIKEKAKQQAKFVREDQVKELLINFKKELLDLMLNKDTFENSEKLKKENLSKLAEKIANETGLKKETVEEIVKQELGRFVDERLDAKKRLESQDNKEGRKSKIAKAVGLTALPIAVGGVITTGGFGFYGYMAGATVARVGISIAKYFKEKKEKDKIVESITKEDEEKQWLLDSLFFRISLAQQKRISRKGVKMIDETGTEEIDEKIFTKFCQSNPDLLEGYENNDDIIKGLNALYKVDKENNKREWSFLKKFEEFIGWNKHSLESNITATVLYGLLIAVTKEMPILKTAYGALLGAKLGDALGKRLFKLEKTPEIDYDDALQTIINKSDQIENNNNDIVKIGRIITPIAGALAGGLIGWVLSGSEANTLKTSDTTTAVVESTETPVSPVPEQPGAPTSTGIVEGYANPDSYVPNADIDTSAGSVAIESAPFTEIGSGTKLDNLIDENKPLMKQIDGKNSNHLWGLIKAKTEVMVKGVEKIEELKDLASSEERMTYIIDAIKDRVAENPTEFGLKAGANIDNLTSADLQAIAKDEDFNGLIADIFKADHPVDKALDLSEKALANIEANNAYFREVASRLSEGTKLDQRAYDIMGALRENNISSEQAVNIIESLSQPETVQAVNDTTAVAAETARQATQTVAEGIAGATEAGVESSIDLETLTDNEAVNLTHDTSDIEVVDQETTEAEGLIELETGTGNEFQNEATKSAWKDIWKSFRDKDRLLRAGAFSKIFNETGISNAYTDPTSKLEVLTSGHKGSNYLEFTIPSPTESGAVEGNNIQFTINKSKKLVTAVMGDKEAKLNNVKNPDRAIRELFRTLTGK